MFNRQLFLKYAVIKQGTTRLQLKGKYKKDCMIFTDNIEQEAL